MIAERKPEQTRQRILNTAYEEMYQFGYQGMRIDRILQKTKLTKGALYHHFPTKKALGFAIIDELLLSFNRQHWADQLLNTTDPLIAIQSIMKSFHANYGSMVIQHGCPINNLTQELPALDEGFKERIDKLYMQWCGAISAALAQGQKNGIVKNNIDPDIVSMFIISSFQGLTGTAKCTNSIENLMKLTATLADYVETLRA